MVRFDPGDKDVIWDGIIVNYVDELKILLIDYRGGDLSSFDPIMVKQTLDKFKKNATCEIGQGV